MSTIYLKHLNNKIQLQRIFLVISSIFVCLFSEYYFDFNPKFKLHQYFFQQHKSNQIKLIKSARDISHARLIKTELIKSKLQHFKMTGYLFDGNNFLAILKLPNGKSIIVAQNEFIGIENLRVTTINKDQIWFSSQNQTFVIKNSL